MKTTFLKISVFILLFSFMGAGCGKEEEEEDLSYLDYTKSISTPPGFAIYKTQKDYFQNVNLYRTSTGEIEGSLGFVENDSRVTVYKGKYYYNSRYRLDDNYILSTEIKVNDCFTSISFDEYIRNKMSSIYNEGGLINQKIIQSIIDEDPFTEFYSFASLDYKAFTIQELNQLIKEKTLQKYFKKLK